MQCYFTPGISEWYLDDHCYEICGAYYDPMGGEPCCQHPSVRIHPTKCDSAEIKWFQEGNEPIAEEQTEIDQEEREVMAE